MLLISEFCVSPMGVESRSIANAQITASSQHSAPWGPSQGRLNNKGGSWIPAAYNADQWIQVNFKVPKVVAGVITQGRYNSDAWVTKYKVDYGNDGTKWKSVQSAEQNDDLVCV